MKHERYLILNRNTNKILFKGSNLEEIQKAQAYIDKHLCDCIILDEEIAE